MNRIVARTMLAALVAAAGVGTAWAGATGQCIKAASLEYKECKGTCKEDYQAAKDACINKDHVCVDACREGRAECRDATGFEADLDVCQSQKAEAVADCRELYAAGTAELDACIDIAQLAAFQCRDGAREANKDDLKACHAGFKTCRTACPDGVGPVIDVKQCKLDAKTAYVACAAACREDYQLGKDTCRNRDHACVEQCRADREVCRQPIEDTLSAALAAINATKQAAIAACNGDDSCIDLAQATAFAQRDQAREDAKPGFEACRTAFQGCATSCPPPPPAS